MTQERIPTNTNEAIVRFIQTRLSDPVSQRFTVGNLITYVESFHFGTSRDTIDRALRQLRRSGKLNYGVVNRATGTFVALPVESQFSPIYSEGVRIS